MEEKLMQALVPNVYVNGLITLKHARVPIPNPAKDEVLIKLEATSLNPVDWKAHGLRALMRPFLANKSPLIPCTDVAGEVVKIGPEVKNFKPGDKVVAVLKFFSGGGLSEYSIANESMTVLRPPEVSAAQAAGLPIAGLTAHLALTQLAAIELNKTAPQKNILVTAASGGVGQYAVQLATLGNHYVTATCGARNIDLVKSLGADEVLDYKTPEGAALKSPSGRLYDAVIHCAPETPWAVFEPNLSENGVVVDLTPGPRSMCTFVMKKLTRSKKKLVPLLLTFNSNHCLGYLVELMKQGKLKTIIDSTYPLCKAEEAWAKGIDGHATGKIIVEQ